MFESESLWEAPILSAKSDKLKNKNINGKPENQSDFTNKPNENNEFTNFLHSSTT